MGVVLKECGFVRVWLWVWLYGPRGHLRKVGAYVMSWLCTWAANWVTLHAAIAHCCVF